MPSQTKRFLLFLSYSRSKFGYNNYVIVECLQGFWVGKDKREKKFPFLFIWWGFVMSQFFEINLPPKFLSPLTFSLQISTYIISYQQSRQQIFTFTSSHQQYPISLIKVYFFNEKSYLSFPIFHQPKPRMPDTLVYFHHYWESLQEFSSSKIKHIMAL